MADRRVIVFLETAGGEARQSNGSFAEFTAAQRVGRSGMLLLASVGLAVLFLPIPIIHLLAIPMILLGGILSAIRQLSVVGRLGPLRIACPSCGVPNRVGGGLGVRSMAPQRRSCESCRRQIVVRIEPIG